MYQKLYKFIFFVAQPKLGFIKSIFKIGQLKNFLILLFESKTELDGSIPKITSDPISEQTFKIFFY